MANQEHFAFFQQCMATDEGIEQRLCQVNLSNANLREASFVSACLNEADLTEASLCKTRFTRGTLAGCRIYGISAWDVDLEGTVQKDLIISSVDESTITVNNVEIAQFIYLLLNNQKLRQVIDTVTSQVVLIIGHFAGERKAVLQALKDAVSKRDNDENRQYSPVTFDVGETSSDRCRETLRTLANMARFVIIDPTNVGDVLSHLEAIVPYCRVPIQFLIQYGFPQEYVLWSHLSQKHFWILPPYQYHDPVSLPTALREKFTQLEKKEQELKQRKPIKLFFGYAPQDQKIVDQLESHLRPLERFGQIELWDQRLIRAGEKKEEEMERALSAAHIILLLLSPDFLVSTGFNHIQERTLEKYESKKNKVIPLLIRPCNWEHMTLLGTFAILPSNKIPIKSNKRRNRDELLAEISGTIIDSIRE